MKLDIRKRQAGILVPLFAIRTENDLGIGDIGGMRQMIDWCKANNFSVLQILPINETLDDNSPYNSSSSIALEPITLEITPQRIPGLIQADLDELAPAELLKKLRSGSVRYADVKILKYALLFRAFERFENTKHQDQNAFNSYQENEKSWLDDYTFFRALIDYHQRPDWQLWPDEHKTLPAAQAWLKALPEGKRNEFTKSRRFFAYIQWLLDRQWRELKTEAEAKGVYLMGDIPIGISPCSADAWANRDIFDSTWSCGAPPEEQFRPDEFTAKWGQSWGFPLYRWDVMKKDNYAWWRKRVGNIVKYFHAFRIDHVLGFYRIYALPWQPRDNHLYVDKTREEVQKMIGKVPRFFPCDDDTPEHQAINQKSGEELLKMILEAVGDGVVIGEDLGTVPPYVPSSLEKLGISGFRIPPFERTPEGEYKDAAKYPYLSLATLTTHDHPPIQATWESHWNNWQETESERTKRTLNAEREHQADDARLELYRMQRFAGLGDKTLIGQYEPAVREALIRSLMKANSWLAIVMITDLIGSTQRFNVPGSLSDGNWSARLPFTVKELAESAQFEKIRSLSKAVIYESDRA